MAAGTVTPGLSAGIQLSSTRVVLRDDIIRRTEEPYDFRRRHSDPDEGQRPGEFLAVDLRCDVRLHPSRPPLFLTAKTPAELPALVHFFPVGRWCFESELQEMYRTSVNRMSHSNPDTIRLWTMKPLAVWEALQREGELYVDEALIPDLDEYFAPYAWMRKQMRQRVPGYTGRYPWWAYDYKLDLRTQRYQVSPPGARYVRMELAVPRARVLLSAYGEWHTVLGGGFLSSATDDTDQEDAERNFAIEVRSAGIERYWRPWLPEPFQSRRARSWERIFDVEELRETNTIQATFELLALREVVAVTPFTAARRRERW